VRLGLGCGLGLQLWFVSEVVLPTDSILVNNNITEFPVGLKR
jgi:hypothetical protein